MVVNAPQSNIVSAAEHAVALLLAVGPAASRRPTRPRSPASGSARSSPASRSPSKTVGVVGLGRIGVLVAQRLSAFGVRLVAYDPYVPAGRAAQIGVRLVSLDDLLRESDFITIHLPKTPETLGLIGERELRAGQARRAHHQRRARRPGRRARARAGAQGGPRRRRGLDVFATEPCTDSPAVRVRQRRRRRRTSARRRPRRRTRPALAVARSVRLALTGEFVPDAVNVQAGGVIAEEIRPACRWSRSSAASSRRWPASVASKPRRRGARRDRRARRQRAQARRAQGPLRRRRRGAGHLRQRAAVRRASAASTFALITDDGEPGLPQPAHAAGHAWSRRRGVSRVRHAVRHRACREADRRRTASTSTSRRPRTWRSSGTRTGRASSAPSAASWARPGQHREHAGRAAASRAATR